MSMFSRMIGRFLPLGRAWNQEPGSGLSKLLAGLAEEVARIRGRADALLLEADPRTTTELIDQWEQVVGLPGSCEGLAETLEDRRAAVTAKVTARQAQTKAYYVGLIASLGFTITEDDITETAPHVFSILLPAETTRYFRASANYAGDRLTTFGNELLECVVLTYKPAHARVLFLYGG